MLTGIKIEEKQTTPIEPPGGREYKQTWITSSGNPGTYLIDQSTDLSALAQDVQELIEAIRKNSNSKLFGVLKVVAAVTAVNIASICEDLVAQFEISTIGLLDVCNLNLLTAFDAALKGLDLEKDFNEGVAVFQTAYRTEIDNPTVATGSGGMTIVTVSNPGFAVSDTVIVDLDPDGTGRAVEEYELVVSAVTSTLLTLTYSGAVQASYARATIQEHPDDYVMRASDEFSGFSSDYISVVAPIMDIRSIGALLGTVSKIQVQTTACRWMNGAIKNVEINSRYKTAHFTVLDDAGFTFLKRDKPFPDRVRINDDLIFSKSSMIKRLCQRRMINKAKFLILFRGTQLIGEEIFPPTQSGADDAAFDIADDVLTKMQKLKTPLNPEIDNLELTATWNGENLVTHYKIYDIKRLLIADTSIEILPPQAP